MRYFVIYLAAINILTFCVYGADKRRAKIQRLREKLGDKEGNVIVTVRGIGYRLNL